MQINSDADSATRVVNRSVTIVLCAAVVWTTGLEKVGKKEGLCLLLAIISIQETRLI